MASKRDLKKMTLYKIALKAKNHLVRDKVELEEKGLYLRTIRGSFFVEKDSDYCALMLECENEWLLVLKPQRDYLKKKLIKKILETE